jgi:V8-like Glu-specific endopeptidase
MLIAGYIYHNDQRGCIKVAHDIASKPADGAQIMRDLTPVLQTSIDQAKLLFGIKSTEEPAMASTGPTRRPVAETPKADDRAVVVIKGDVAEGTGFLVKTAGGPVVITNLHVIFANTNWHIMTSTGEEIKTTALYGASDRDLAMFTIQDDNYHYLTLAADVSNSASRDDPVVTPGNSEGGEVILDTPGKVLGIGPERVEISNPVYHGNSGGPIVDQNGNQVLGVVTFATNVTPSDAVDEASHANPNSAIAGPMRYFGLRIDTVPQWQPYDPQIFLTQTTFLEQFHENSRCLDSLLNGQQYEKLGLVDKGAPDSKYYLHNQRLHDYVIPHLIEQGATDEMLEEARVAVLDCQKFGEEDMPGIENPANFYSFEWKRAKEEAVYRKKLLDELQQINDRI